MPFCDLATGARFHYEDVGTGEPLILLHGLLGTAIRDLEQVMLWLGKRYHIYGPSLRGYGESTPKPRDFPLDFYHRDAKDVLAFMDALHIDSAHVLGYSDGGETALVAAGLQPQRFKSVAVIGAVGNFSPAIRPRVQSMYPATWITDEEKQFHSIPDANAFILQWINAMKHTIDTGGDISLGLAHKISSPVLIMLGDKDTLNPAEYALKFIEQTPHGRLQMFACGHPIHQELPDAFKQVYGDFLEQVG